jgi:hypothetical protein
MINSLSILVLLHTSVRVATREKPLIFFLFSVAAASLNWLLLPYAYENSLPEIMEQISTGIWADNFMLVVSLDVLLGLVLCVRQFKRQHKETVKHPWIELIPPLLLIPVLYYIDASFFYRFPQFSYTTSGVILFLAISTGLPLMGYFIQWLLGFGEAVAEFRALLNLALFSLVLAGPLLKISQPGYQAPLHLDALAVVAAICLAAFLTGIVVFKLKRKFNKNYK